MKQLKIGIDNYGLHPLELTPFETLDWAKEHGAEGVQFSGLSERDNAKVDETYLRDLAQRAESHSLYLEWGGGQHVPYDMSRWREKDIFESNRRVAEQAQHLGVRVVRSCSGGLMRWDGASPPTETLLEATAKCLREQRNMLQDHGVILAIETHFEFTTFELRRLFERCDAEPGEFLGICLDTMNLFTMLEDPLRATERILPWVVSTHIKDGSLRITQEGLTSFPVELGRGIIDLPRVIKKLMLLPWDVHLSIEDHGGWFSLPVFDPLFLSKFPDLSLEEYSSLLKLAKNAETMNNAGNQITAREAWPVLCETRLRDDIRNLKNIVAGRSKQ